jgi:hypothetical protein
MSDSEKSAGLIGWVVDFHRASEVYQEDEPEVPLTSTDSVRVGDHVLVTAFGQEHTMVIQKESGVLCVISESGYTKANLFFDSDRKCWVSSVAFGKVSLVKVKQYMPP